MDLNLFKNRIFTTCALVLAIMQSCFISFVFWMIFLQNILKFSPNMAGLLMLPVTIPLTFMGALAGYIRDKYGPRLPISVGVACVIVSMIWVGSTSWLYSYSWMFFGFLLLGFSTSLVISNCIVTGLSAIAAEKRGVAAGTFSALRQLGSALGLAITGSVISNINIHQLSHFFKSTVGSVPQVDETKIEGILAGTEAAKQTIASLAIDPQVIHHAAVHAYTVAFSIAMYAVAAVAMGGFLLARRLPTKLGVKNI